MSVNILQFPVVGKPISNTVTRHITALTHTSIRNSQHDSSTNGSSEYLLMQYNNLRNLIKPF